MFKIKKLYLFEASLIILSFLYFLIFVNKGLVFLDEGYFTHAAERIFNGLIPYKDFSLPYGPTYFYILSFLYKIFQPSVLVGRFFSLFICILIILVNFLILNKLKVKPYLIFLSLFGLIAFGYPLINIPNIIWFNVFLGFLSALVFIYWLQEHKPRYIFTLGILLALSISAKQNLGAAFVVLFTFLILFSNKETWIKKIKNLSVIYLTWISLTFVWVYYFFLINNLQGLTDFVNYNKRFSTSIAFSYPPLTYIFQPLGLFKLLPYYLPFILLFAMVILLYKKYRDWNIISFTSVALTGFFVSVFPQSDLLHVYPFLGMVLVSFLLLPFRGKMKIFVLAVIIIMILIGFYLTFFTKSYRYENYYYKYDTYLNLPRTQGVMITKSDADAVLNLSGFINKNTLKNDYVFVYPYSPVLYFILERKNPSKDSLYYLPNWHFYSDKYILSELKQKKVKYIITDGNYILNTDLSRFIQKQRKIFEDGRFRVFEVKY